MLEWDDGESWRSREVEDRHAPPRWICDVAERRKHKAGISGVGFGEAFGLTQSREDAKGGGRDLSVKEALKRPFCMKGM